MHLPWAPRRVALRSGATPPLGERARYLMAALLLVPYLCRAALTWPRPDALCPIGRASVCARTRSRNTLAMVTPPAAVLAYRDGAMRYSPNRVEWVFSEVGLEY
jgi:hypothetical protein